MKPVLPRTVFVLVGLLAGCSPYPRDIEGTTERVERNQELRVGFGNLAEAQRKQAERFAQTAAAKHGARLLPQFGQSNEAMFALLEANKLDLVLTEVATDSPWLSEIAVIEPLARRRVQDRELGLSPVARNGENRWIMRLEGQVRDAGGS